MISLSFIYLLLSVFILSVVSNFLIIYVYKNRINLSIYEGLQRSHVGEIPRFGGVVIYFFFILCNVQFTNKYLNNINIEYMLITTLPIYFICLFEDNNYLVHTIKRLFLIFLCSLILIFILDNNHNLSKLLSIDIFHINHPILTIFTFLSLTICCLGLINGCNFIDGCNGNLGFTLLFSSSFLAYLSYINNDELLLMNFLTIIVLIISFLIFNFPKGYLFAGDFGAYILSFILFFLALNLYARNSYNISIFFQLLIFTYPIWEVIFSTLRKIYISKISPFSPDRDHLHILIFDYLKKHHKFSLLKANNLSTVILLTLQVPILIGIIFYNNSETAIFFFIISFIVLYSLLYKTFYTYKYN